jgi:nucleoside-diphosphate-sugar epimerase
VKVFLTGATGVMGRSAVGALLAAGHDVAGLARTSAKARTLAEDGVRPVLGSLFDPDTLTEAFQGCEVVCNLATHIPIGLSALRAHRWRINDRIRTEGSLAVARAARQAGVRRLVQESVSFVYADGGDSWLDETSPLLVTRATEPAAQAETNASAFAGGHRSAVVLRFGAVVGDDPLTRWWLARARAGQPIGIGDPSGWEHVVHTRDVGSAVVAALHAPGGVYNAGAQPVRRGDLADAFATAAGRERATYLPGLLVRLAGERIEPLLRSHRVSSARLADFGGWAPVHAAFSADWLDETRVSA